MCAGLKIPSLVSKATNDASLNFCFLERFLNELNEMNCLHLFVLSSFFLSGKFLVLTQ